MASGRITLGFVGDLMAGRRVSAALADAAPDQPWRAIAPLLAGCAGLFGNLEGPISGGDALWRRSWKAFRFRAAPAMAAVLAAASFRFVSLANNHILDCEAEGLAETRRHLTTAGIAHAGAGANSAEAARPALVDVGGLAVGVIAITDTMPGFAARPDRPGTNFMRIRDDHVTLALLHSQIERLRRDGADLVVLSAHWGPNLRPWPSPRIRRFARRAVELGVDLVHGHSAHIVQGIEVHHGAPILYDTGDFLDDYWVFPGVRTDRTFLFLADVDGGRISGLRLVPLSLAPAEVRRPGEFEHAAICARMRRLCRWLGTEARPTVQGLAIAAGEAAAARGELGRTG